MIWTSKTIASSLAAACAAIVLVSPAAAAINVPGCGELVKFGQEIDARQLVSINKVPSRFALPAVFMGERSQQVFGQPILAWTQEDVAAAVKATGDCANEAKKARRTPEIQALTALWQQLGGVRSVLGGIAVTEQRVDQWLKVLVEDPAARPTLVVLQITQDVKDGTPESFQKAEKALKDHSVRINAWHPVATHAQNLMTQLRDVPTASMARVFPPIEKRVGEVREAVIAEAGTQINAAPEAPEALKVLAAYVPKTKAELLASLSDADYAGLDKLAVARSAAIEDALAAKEIARIDAVPETPDGLNMLRMAQVSPVKAALSPQRVAAIDARIVARRNTIGKTVTDEQIKRLDQFPATMAGLRDLDGFKNSTANGLAALAGAEQATRFREAATKRATKIGEDSFGPFQKALGEMPATEEGLRQLDAALEQIKGPIGALDASVRTRYADAAAKRRGDIVAAVQKEDARLAKLPMTGAVFMDPQVGAKLEFRNKTRVYVTLFRDQTSEGEYEIDDNKVIIRLPGNNTVFARDGAWLRGGGLNLKRQAEK